MPTNKPLRSQAKNIVFNVYCKIREEEGVNQTQSLILNHDVELTGVSSTTVMRIVCEDTSNDCVFFTPSKKEKGKKKITIQMLEERFIINIKYLLSSSSDEEQEMQAEFLELFSSSE